MRERPAERLGACLLDIEGVLVRDKRYRPVDGAVDWVRGLVDCGVPFALVSNNTTHPPRELAAALAGVGFPVTADHVVSALAVGARLLAGWGKTRLLWLGRPELAPWWREQGFVTDAVTDCQAVVLGLNEQLSVADLDRALSPLVDQEAELVALHRNLFYLDSRGERRFGPGFYCAALAEAAARDPVVIGKPHERIYREGLERVGLPADEVLFVSDDPAADLVTAGRLGMTTAFVLSGKHPDHAVLGRLDQQEWPDIIAASLADVTPPEGPAGITEGNGTDE